jgi:hypothetical protein
VNSQENFCEKLKIGVRVWNWIFNGIDLVFGGGGVSSTHPSADIGVVMWDSMWLRGEKLTITPLILY